MSDRTKCPTCLRDYDTTDDESRPIVIAALRRHINREKSDVARHEEELAKLEQEQENAEDYFHDSDKAARQEAADE